MEKYDLDKIDFDYIILGTGLSESILSASLSSNKKSVINVEFDNIYSGELKSMNIKEIKKFLINEDIAMKNQDLINIENNKEKNDSDSEKNKEKMDSVENKEKIETENKEKFNDQKKNKIHSKNKEKIISKNKDKIYFEKKIHFYDSSYKSIDCIIKKIGFRGFNIDLKTLFLLSDSFSTEEMINIGIDNYLSFNSIKSIYHSNGKNFFKIPVSKKMIFCSKNLNLFQKKEFLQRLDKIQKFVQFQYKELKNVNSIKDLEKEIYEIPENLNIFQKLGKNLKNNHSELFEVLYEKEDKFFEDILRYSLVARRRVKTDDFLDLENFLRKFKDFVKSMGVHAVYPYLYPIYGIGDVSQVFTRISALHQSIFLLNENFKIGKIQKNKEEEKKENIIKEIIKEENIVKENIVEENIKEEKIEEEKIEEEKKEEEEIKSEKKRKYSFILNHGEHNYNLQTDNFIIGPDFIETFKNSTNTELTIKKEEYQFINILVKDPDSFKISDLPIIINIPEKDEILKFESPIRIIITGFSTKNTPEGFSNISISFLKIKKISKINFNLENFSEKILDLLKIKLDFDFKPIFRFSFIKKSIVEIFEKSKNKDFIFLKSIEDDITLEDYFKQCRDVCMEIGIIEKKEDYLIKKIKREKNFKENEDDFEKELDDLAAFTI